MTRLRHLGFCLVIMVCLIISVSVPASALNYLSLDGFTTSALINTVDEPNNHVVTPSSIYDGVGKIIVSFPSGTYGGSGTLLSQGGHQYLLTAGHMVDDEGSLPLSFTVNFSGGGIYTGMQFYLHPLWDGDYQNGYDIALVKLSATVPLAGYDILRTEIAGTVTGNIAGYGYGGTGALGTYLPFGTLRQGYNTFGEAYWQWPGLNGLPYAYDFDNGFAARNTINNLAGLTDELLFAADSNLGLHNDEVLIAPGDSGGPTFIGGKIAGVHSFRATHGMPWDIDDDLNSSFGELGGDTRVAMAADWIDRVAVVPLPSGVYLLASGLGLLVVCGGVLRHTN